MGYESIRSTDRRTLSRLWALSMALLLNVGISVGCGPLEVLAPGTQNQDADDGDGDQDHSEATNESGDFGAPCLHNSECQSDVCYGFRYEKVDGEWIVTHGACSLQGEVTQANPTCLSEGGAEYLPGDLTTYCLPACNSNSDCSYSQTCCEDGTWCHIVGQKSDAGVCGYW